MYNIIIHKSLTSRINGMTTQHTVLHVSSASQRLSLPMADLLFMTTTIVSSSYSSNLRPCHDNYSGVYSQYFQHAHFIPIVSGCGKERRILVGPW